MATGLEFTGTTYRELMETIEVAQIWDQKALRGTRPGGFLQVRACALAYTCACRCVFMYVCVCVCNCECTGGLRASWAHVCVHVSVCTRVFYQCLTLN